MLGIKVLYAYIMPTVFYNCTKTENGISKLNRFILIAPVLWSDTAEDSVKMVQLQELYGEINTVYRSVCIFL